MQIYLCRRSVPTEASEIVQLFCFSPNVFGNIIRYSLAVFANKRHNKITVSVFTFFFFMQIFIELLSVIMTREEQLKLISRRVYVGIQIVSNYFFFTILP